MRPVRSAASIVPPLPPNGFETRCRPVPVKAADDELRQGHQHGRVVDVLPDLSFVPHDADHRVGMMQLCVGWPAAVQPPPRHPLRRMAGRSVGAECVSLARELAGTILFGFAALAAEMENRHSKLGANRSRPVSPGPIVLPCSQTVAQSTSLPFHPIHCAFQSTPGHSGCGMGRCRGGSWAELHQHLSVGGHRHVCRGTGMLAIPVQAHCSSQLPGPLHLPCHRPSPHHLSQVLHLAIAAAGSESAVAPDSKFHQLQRQQFLPSATTSGRLSEIT